MLSTFHVLPCVDRDSVTELRSRAIRIVFGRLMEFREAEDKRQRKLDKDSEMGDQNQQQKPPDAPTETNPEILSELSSIRIKEQREWRRVVSIAVDRVLSI